MMYIRQKVAVLVTIGIMGALAGCGSDDSNTSGTSVNQTGATTAASSSAAGESTSTASSVADTTQPAGGDALTKKLQSVVDQGRKIDDKIFVTTPLPQPPPKGKTVAYFQCEVASVCNQASQIQEAIDALGWKLVTINSSLNDPTVGWDAAFQAKPDYIINTTSPPAVAIETQLAEAKQRGIAVILPYVDEPATGAQGNGITATLHGAQSELQRVTQTIDWIGLNDPSAKIVYVTMPDFPIMVKRSALLRKVAATDCPGCKITDLDVPIADLVAGTIPTRVVSYLQQNPDTTHVFFGFNGLETGSPQALAEAGLAKKFTLVVEGINAEILHGVADGTIAMGLARSPTYSNWVAVDAAARLSLGLSLDDMTEQYTPEDLLIVDSAEAANKLLKSHDPFFHAGPTNMQQQFKELWGVN